MLKSQRLNTSTGLSPLPVTDLIMNNTFWVGVYPGMTEEMMGYMVETIKGAFR
jgi:CDP-6-deoxy-D-xylo-4-hexulose-3-dehydrase